MAQDREETADNRRAGERREKVLFVRLSEAELRVCRLAAVDAEMRCGCDAGGAPGGASSTAAAGRSIVVGVCMKTSLDAQTRNASIAVATWRSPTS
jgi:hypothetical protein